MTIEQCALRVLADGKWKNARTVRDELGERYGAIMIVPAVSALLAKMVRSKILAAKYGTGDDKRILYQRIRRRKTS